MLYLFTHAFFKALLFLGCGSVIHATREAGGRQARRPLEARCRSRRRPSSSARWRWPGSSRSPASGRRTRSSSRRRTTSTGHRSSSLLIAAAAHGAVHAARLSCCTFLGEPKDHHVYEHAHESPPGHDGAADPARRARVVAGFVVFEASARRSASAQRLPRVRRQRLARRPARVPLRLCRSRSSRSSLVGVGLGAAMYCWAGDGERRRRLRRAFSRSATRCSATSSTSTSFYQWMHQQRRPRRSAASSPGSTAPSSTTPASTAPAQVDGLRRLGAASTTQTGKLPNYALAIVARRGRARHRRLRGEGANVDDQDTCSWRYIAIPLLAAAAARARPRRPEGPRPHSSPSLSALVLFVISHLHLLRLPGQRQRASSQFVLRWTWLENVGFLGENGITLHLGIDGIAAPMVLLNGVVTFAGTLISWKIEHQQQGLLHPVLAAGGRRLRHLLRRSTCSSSSSSTSSPCCRCTC